MTRPAILWLRRDLRVADNPALAAATSRGGGLVAVHVLETGPGPRSPGAAARWWLHRSLAALADDLAALGIPLETHVGDAAGVLGARVRVHKAGAVFWNRRYEPAAREVDGRFKAQLRADGIEAKSFPGDVLVEPFDIETGSGGPYAVFTPFWRALLAREIATPLPAPAAIGAGIGAGPVDAGYDPPKWSAKLAGHWSVGEAAARRALTAFLDVGVAGYPEDRDRPALAATSRLSPHLAFGEISARQVWHAARHHAARHPAQAAAIEKFLTELAWRDFNIHQLYHRADIATVAMQARFDGLAWREAPDDLKAWQQGRTGIPIVDAGMRELWGTGYMHNRVRMLVASLLAKNLMIDWRQGERWFWDTLCDADVASNPGNWQWVAGSGLDAAPYFRIFNPVLQGEKYDAGGAYVRRWVPELARLPDTWIHRPFEAPADALRAAGVSIGADYPPPIVDLKRSRAAALAAFQRL